jgi:hypothetical protein
MHDHLLKIWNTTSHGRAGMIALFNCRYGLPSHYLISGSLTPHDVPMLDGSEFVVYLHRAGTTHRLPRHEHLPVHLPQAGWELATVLPVDEIVPIGLVDKLNPHAAVEAITRRGNVAQAAIRDAGMFAAWCQNRPGRVEFNGSPVPFDYHENLLKFHIPAPGSITIAP